MVISRPVNSTENQAPTFISPLDKTVPSRAGEGGKTVQFGTGNPGLSMHQLPRPQRWSGRASGRGTIGSSERPALLRHRAAFRAPSGPHARRHACTCVHGTRRMAASGSEDRQRAPLTKHQHPSSGFSGRGRGYTRGGARPGAEPWRGGRHSRGRGLREAQGRVRCWWGRGAGRWGRGAEARARSRGSGLRAAQPASRGNLLRLACQAYLGLLFRHGCAATVAASAVGTGGTGAGESRSLPRRSPAATVAGPRFIPKSRRAGWPRGVTWPGACTRRVPRAAGARWPAAIPDGCECVTGRVRRPGARRDPGTRDSRSWAPRPRMWVQGCAATQGAGMQLEDWGVLVLGQEPEEGFGPTGSNFTIHVWGLFLYAGCIWGGEGEETQGHQANPYRWSGRTVRRLPGKDYGPHTPGTDLWP